MKCLELFAGTRSIGRAFERRGHEVYSIEWDKDFDHIDWYTDIMTVTAQDILNRFGRPDVIWASPDCATFSIAAISHHRRKNPETGNLDPVSEYAKFCDALDQHVLRLILALSPTYWFIENPRGGMRKMTWMEGLPRYTVTYCQYGDTLCDDLAEAADLIEAQAKEIDALRNELCLKCGNYTLAHEGACNGCRWRR